jgi:cysteinyl-tRNA synthetase
LARRFDVAELLARTPEGYVVEGMPPAVGVDPDASAAFRTHMDDDLDTPGALAGIFELVTAAHSAADGGDEEEGARQAHTAAVLAAALGLSLRAADTDVDEESARLVSERDEARRAKDFARADALRDELVARGWTVEDTAGGTAIRR